MILKNYQSLDIVYGETLESISHPHIFIHINIIIQRLPGSRQ
jgi:ABC-type uncharacterized transport system substrate-binding protein